MNRLFVMAIVTFLLAACTIDPVRPQAVYEATATARAEIALLPTATPTSEPEVVPTEEVGEPVQDPTPVPPCEQIKGNISRSGEKIYHVPGGANYDQVKIDESKGEQWFCSEEEAQAAGWRKASR